MKPIYLDNNATTPADPLVLEAMLPYYKKIYGNASSFHAKGRQAREGIDKARHIIASSLATEDNDIIFTGGGTESDNLAIKGVCIKNRDKGNHIITAKIEHHAVLNTCKFLETQGFSVTYLNVDKFGLVSPDDLKNAITDKTILVTIMHANNEVGTIEPIKELARLARERGIYFHTDAVQAFGKIAIDVEDLGVDLLSISAHKIHGPKGVGALYIRKGVKISSIIHGGHHERNLRAGTENVAGIVGFGKAAELAKEHFAKNEDIRILRDKLHNGLINNIERVYLNGHPTQRLSNTLNLSFEYIEGESLILNLDLKGVCIATGSACTSGSLEPSHVLIAMGVDPAIAQGSIRFSLSKLNTEGQIDYCIKLIPKIVKKLRRMSPLYKP